MNSGIKLNRYFFLTARDYFCMENCRITIRVMNFNA